MRLTVFTLLAAATAAVQTAHVHRNAHLVPRQSNSAQPSGTQTGQTGSKSQLAVYWGRGGGQGQPPLGDWCEANAAVNIVILAFVNDYSNGKTPNYQVGIQCASVLGGPDIAPPDKDGSCGQIEDGIKRCQAAKKTVLMSLGGYVLKEPAPYTNITDDADAKDTAKKLWDMFGDSKSKAQGRPFNDASVDGFDLDVEWDGAGSNENNKNYPAMVTELRNLAQQDTGKQLVMSGAPQCPFRNGAIAHMDIMVQGVGLDYVFIQFFNNDPCSAYNGDISKINWNDWVNYIAQGDSKDAQMFIGLPAAREASLEDVSKGGVYYLQPDDLKKLLDQYKSSDKFSGVMLWDAGYSEANQVGGCSYHNQVASVLSQDRVCGS